MDPAPDLSTKEGSSSASRDCSYCKSVHDALKHEDPVGNQWADMCSSIFHTPCVNCQLTPLLEQSCSFCQHLRLEHIIKCVFSNLDYLVKCESALKLSLGTIEEIRARQPCQFCTMIYAIADRYAGAKEPGQTLFLDVDWDHVAPNAIAIMRVGDDPDPPWWAIVDVFENRLGAQAAGTSVQYQTSEEPNWELVSRWVDTCTSHGSACSPTALDPPRHFRLIDVDKACVVSSPPRPEYMALSYIWGRAPTFRAMRENIHSLGETGSLLSCNLPATVKDAMVVCRRLGKRYLWVDAVCIVQDDPEVIESNINRMNLIYRHACLTIVACAGNHSNHGLPGVSRTRTPEMRLDMGGITLVEQTENLRNTLDFSKWPSRAWTYQEAILSSKLLFFRDSSVVFECKSSSDQYEVEIRGIPGAVYNESRDVGYDFFVAVNDYSGRDLTDDRDVLRGFTGILTHLHGDEHFFGAPLQEFDAALFWEPGTDSTHRTCHNAEPFPSWSWTSMRGARYNAITVHKDIGGSLASWAFVKTDSSGCHIPIPIRSSPAASESTWTRNSSDTGDKLNFLSVAAAIAWREGCIKEEPPYPLRDGKMPWEDLRSFILSRWPTHEQFWEESRAKGAYVKHFSAQDIQLASSSPGRLLGLTQFATLQLVPDLESTGCPINLRNASGKCLGQIDINDDQRKELLSTHARGEEVRIEFIALSLKVPVLRDRFGWDRLRTEYLEANRLMGPEFGSDEAVFFRNEEGELLENDDGAPELIMLNVMMVEARGEVYRRSGLATVGLKRWLESDPKLRSFVLW